MKLMNWVDKKIKRMNVWDISLLKIDVLIIGIIIGAYLSTFILKNVLYFVSLAIIGYFILVLRFFRKSKK